jgi:hypothetical protein
MIRFRSEHAFLGPILLKVTESGRLNEERAAGSGSDWIGRGRGAAAPGFDLTCADWVSMVR